MCRSSRMMNMAMLTVVSEIKNDFHAGWGNHARDSQPVEKEACHWNTVALASLSSLGYACCIRA